MILFFIRHAQSVNNALAAEDISTKGRHSDPELTSQGEQQAERLAEFLRRGGPSGGQLELSRSSAGFGITHLYTSLMVRSVATGAVIARRLNLPLLAWEELHERGGIFLEDQVTGELIGLSGEGRAYFEEYFPELLLPRDLPDAGWWNSRPFEGAEQWPTRAWRFLAQLRTRHGGSEDRVAVVSHGGFYNDFLRALLPLPAEPKSWFELNNVAITRIDFQEDIVIVKYHNRIDYLPADMVT
ncbi:MAG TPA: histidine phosphatase family protein [Anaerolineales bacterium]|nr:histidine phosphatase family protein [Anaerolineales bacterium]